MARCFLIELTFETVPESIEFIVDAVLPGAACFVLKNVHEDCSPGVIIYCAFGPDDYEMSPGEAMRVTCDYLVNELHVLAANKVTSIRSIVVDEDCWFEGEIPTRLDGTELARDVEQTTACAPSDTRLATCNSSLKSGQLHPCSPACQ